MAITVDLPLNTPFSIIDLPDIIDFIATEASVTLDSSTQFSGTGVYTSASSTGVGTYIATGSGFATTTVGGETFVSAGIIDTIVFSSAQGDMTFSMVDIDMAVFTPIVIDDIQGTNLFGIENFLQNRAWDIGLGDVDDIAPKGTLIGDGAALNLLGDDVIRGRGGNDNLFGGDGKDKLYGDTGNDILSGGKGSDRLDGGKGKDKLIGSNGLDRLFGGDGKDNLKGGDGLDKLYGGAGRDVLAGGRNDDILVGEGGFDRFVFKDNSGRDTVKDFNLSAQEDIDLKGVTQITSYADLTANHMTQVGRDILIDDNAGTQIVLEGILLANLGKGDFLF